MNRMRMWAVGLLMAVAWSGCMTTGSSTSSNRKMVLVGPDGTRYVVPHRDNPPRAEPLEKPYAWHPEFAPAGPVKLDISLTEQRLYIYRNGVQIGWTSISTGREGYGTPAGEYKILQKRENHHSTLYGSFVDNASGRVVSYEATAKMKPPPGCRYEPAPMPYFQRLTWDGVGLHEGFLPGYAASHGCIRVHEHMADKLFALTSVGTPVRIRY